MLSIFRTNQFYGAIWLLLYFAVLSAWVWIIPGGSAEAPVTNPLFERLFAFLGEQAWVWTLVGMVTILLSALYANHLHNRFDLYEKENYFTGAFFLLPACLFSQFLIFNPVVLASLLLILTVMQVFTVYNEPMADKAIFNGGLLTGAAVLLHTPFLPLTIWLLVIISMLRSFKPREWLIAITGLLTPLWIAFGVFFLIDDMAFFRQEVMAVNFLPDEIGMDAYWLKMAALGVFGLLFMISALNIFGIFPKKVIQVRKYISGILLLIPMLLVGLLFSEEITLGNLFPLIIPYALVTTIVIEHIKRRGVASFIHFTLVIVVLISQYFNFEVLKHIIP